MAAGAPSTLAVLAPPSDSHSLEEAAAAERCDAADGDGAAAAEMGDDTAAVTMASFDSAAVAAADAVAAAAAVAVEGEALEGRVAAFGSSTAVRLRRATLPPAPLM